MSLTELDDEYASHYLGQWGNLLTIFTIEGYDDSQIVVIVFCFTDNIRFGSDFRRRDKGLGIIFIYLFH